LVRLSPKMIKGFFKSPTHSLNHRLSNPVRLVFKKIFSPRISTAKYIQSALLKPSFPSLVSWKLQKKIPISKLQFISHESYEEKQSDAAKMIDFVEHQEDMINVTKSQCALIQITTSSTGTQTFDLPQELKRQTGRDKARKDCYSALVLGNWFTKVYYDMNRAKQAAVTSSFTPFMI